MKNNTFFNLFIILSIAILFRFYFLDKPEGLWNDEYVSWYIASIKDINLFIQKMLQNCHTIFYYLYLKLWMFIFPDTDLSLRISSVVPSLISIPVMYLIGKELNDKKTGILCAFLTAISSFHIYFAQEVRLYSILFLFTAFSVLYFIKSAKSPDKKNILLFILFQSLITITHTLGVIYSFFSIFALIIYLHKYTDFYKNKTTIIKYILPYTIAVILLIPTVYSIIKLNSISQFWSGFSFAKIIFNFVDYFSPIQTNIINTPNSALSFIYKDNSVKYIFIIFGLLPAFLAFIGLYNGIKQKNIILNNLLVSSFLFFLTLIILSAFHKMILITKYSAEIYPSLLLGLSFGLISVKKQKLKIAATVLFIFLNLFYLLTASDAVHKRNRREGNKIVAELIKQSRLKKNDIILLTYYDVDKFERYLDNKDQYRFLSISKYNFNYLLFDGEDYKQLQKNGKYEHIDYFREFPNSQILDFSKNFISNKMELGDRVGIVFLNTVSFLTNETIQDILSDEKKLKYTPFIFLVFSTFKNNIMYSLKDRYKIDSITDYGDWTLVVYEKIY